MMTLTTETAETESFVAALRAQSRRYHAQHPFHRRMNEGGLNRRQIQGWAANRFYYQVNLPRKDAAYWRTARIAMYAVAGFSASSTTTARWMGRAASRPGSISARPWG
jgi:hypothetical protein